MVRVETRGKMGTD